MTETKPLPEWLKKEKREYVYDEYHDRVDELAYETYNDALLRAWELTQERIEKAILEMEKKNHEVQMRNKESGKYQQGFAYGVANAKALIKEVFE